MSRIMIGKYDATIYPEGDGYTGAIDLGVNAKGQRRRVKRKGRTRPRLRTSSAKPSPTWRQASPRTRVTRCRTR